MKRIQVINGPNMNMLGVRETSIYGSMTLLQINEEIKKKADHLGLDLSFFQSNHEGAIVDCIQQCFQSKDGILINPAAYTHYSIAIRDALSSVGLPAVEVHLSAVDKREPFRKISVTKEVCRKQFFGKGLDSYLEALEYMNFLLNSENKREDMDQEKQGE